MIGRLLLLLAAIGLMAFFGWLTSVVFFGFLDSTTILHAVIYGIALLVLLIVDFFVFFLGIFGSIVALFAG